jgi:hypothetical protein
VAAETTRRGLISELTRTLQIVGQSRAAASSSLMLYWVDFTTATRGYSFRKGHVYIDTMPETLIGTVAPAGPV